MFAGPSSFASSLGGRSCGTYGLEKQRGGVGVERKAAGPVGRRHPEVFSLPVKGKHRPRAQPEVFNIINDLGKIIVIDDSRCRRFFWLLALAEGACQIAQRYCVVRLRGGAKRKHWSTEKPERRRNNTGCFMNSRERKRVFSLGQIVVRNKLRNQHGGTNVGRRTLEAGLERLALGCPSLRVVIPKRGWILACRRKTDSSSLRSSE